MDTASIVTIIGAVFGGLVLLMNTWATMQTRLTTLQTKDTVATLQEKTDATADDQNKALAVIHDNGNAHLALMTEKLALSEKKNEELLAGVNISFEKRILELEARLTKKDAQLADVALQGSAEAPLQAEVNQPKEKPIPVKETH